MNQDASDEIGLEPGDFPPGVIVGTVEVVGCRKVRGEYEWDLAKPIRLKRPLKPKNHPQPAWLYPFEDENLNAKLVLVVILQFLC